MLDALQGITVLEVGVMTPGKYCGFLMTGWGARSIRIERSAAGEISNEDLLLNRGKQSIALDLRDEGDLRVFRQLATMADVLIESYRPGVTARLGIDYASIRALNERVIYCSLSGFGQGGPDAGRAAYDLLFQAESGMLQTLFANSESIVPPQTYLADGTAGLMAAFAITAALQGRGQSGAGRHIDLSMQESIFSLLSLSHGTIRDGAAISGRETASWCRRPVYNVYGTQDGRYIAITALSEKSGRALFGYFGHEELWQNGNAVGPKADEVSQFLKQEFSQQPAQFWLDALTACDVEIALVNSPQEAFDNPQLRARNMVEENTDAAGRNLRQIGIPALSGSSVQLGPAPLPGADRRAILDELARRQNEPLAD